jgi:GNAT superfamily N-acetyltransferase
MMSNSDSSIGILIRRAVVADAVAIASVLREAFIEYEPLYTPGGFSATTPTADQIRARWSEGPVWVADQNGSILGTVGAVSKGSGLYVRSMAVLPSARGQGIAGRLLKEVEHFANGYNHTHLFLSTTPFLYDSIRLYENIGFRKHLHCTERSTVQVSEDETHDLSGTPLFTMVKLLTTDKE